MRTAPLQGTDELDAITLARAVAGDRDASRALVERFEARLTLRPGTKLLVVRFVNAQRGVIYYLRRPAN